METFNLLHEFVLVCGIVVTLIILLLLGKKQNGYLHQRLLLSFFVTVLFLFIYHYAAYHRIYWLYVSTSILINGINFLIGPIIYFYVAALFTKVNYTAPRVRLHFLPYLLYTLILSIPMTLSNPIDGLAFPFIGFYIDNSDIFFLLESLYLLIFSILSFNLLTQYTGAIESFYSDVSKTDILWSKRLLLAVIFYLVIDLTVTFSDIWIVDFNNFDIYLNVLTMLLFIIYLGYYGFFQSQILIPSFLLNNQITAPIKSIKRNESKVAHSIFSKSEIENIKWAIEKVLIKDKLYLNESLTLSNLATKVQLTDKKLSTFINQELQTNFYELINRHRIAAFKTEVGLAKNQNLTIWGIASQCGFNSKTSFNRIFKKQTGLTPSQYQKSLSQNG